MVDIERNELSQKAMGGTELMAMGLVNHIDPELYDKFQIICSRVREIDSSRIPVLWLHDLPNDPESHHLADPKSRDRFAKFVFVSNWQMNEYISAYNLPWDKCHVIKNAIDPIEFKSRDADKIRLIYHSTPHRGLEILVPVFEHLQKRWGDQIELDVYSSFKLYGWEERDKPYEELFARMDSNPGINNHGTVDNAEIRTALQKADVFAYPNIWPETSCICAIEALAAGCLMIHPNYAALPETAAEWGISYQWNQKPNDHANLFASILNSLVESIADDKADVENMQLNQSNYYNNFYSWDRRAEQWADLLEQILFEQPK